MGGSKDRLKVTDRNKKRRTGTPIWRPVCTQSSPSEGSLPKDVIVPGSLESTAVKVHGVSEIKGVKVHGLSEKKNVEVCTAIPLETVDCEASAGVTQNFSGDNESIIGLAGSISLSSGVLECNDHAVDLEEKSFTVSASAVEDNLPQSQCTTSDPKAGETIYQERVAEENVHKLDMELQDHFVNGAKRHSTSVQVDASLVRFIRGKGGSTQKQIEGETGVKITFPSSKEDTSIIIEGPSIENVTRASEKVQVILEEAVKSRSLDYSHFISLPLAIHPELVEKLTNFQNSILGNPDSGEERNSDSDSDEKTSEDEEGGNSQLDGSSNVAVKIKVQDDNEHVKVEINRIVVTSYPPKAPTSASVLSDMGIDRSIFIKPKTFHLTVLMLKLWNKERVAAATEVLLKISSKVKDALEGHPVSIRLKGLECMRGSLSKARVLYAPVEEIGGEDRLSSACQVIIEAFVEAGLVLDKDARQKLKLHATVMNARHRKRKKNARRYDSFDARGIIKKYGTEEWGEFLIREAHLSQRFKFDDNGYYYCCASIPFL